MKKPPQNSSLYYSAHLLGAYRPHHQPLLLRLLAFPSCRLAVSPLARSGVTNMTFSSSGMPLQKVPGCVPGVPVTCWLSRCHIDLTRAFSTCCAERQLFCTPSASYASLLLKINIYKKSIMYFSAWTALQLPAALSGKEQETLKGQPGKKPADIHFELGPYEPTAFSGPKAPWTPCFI